MHAIAVPEKAAGRITALLAQNGYEIAEMEDVIRTPRKTIDSRVASTDAAPYGEGLFILQYVAPATPAWQAAVRQSRVSVIDPLPERAVVVAATAEQIRELTKRPWVQYAGSYLPEYKHGPVAAPSHREFTLQVVDTPASAAAVARIRARVGKFVSETRRGSELVAHFRSDLATAQALLAEPFVMAVEAYIPPQPSDERQALGLTGVATLTSSMSYLNWLAARNITPNALTNSGIVVDIADTGVDYGCYNGTAQHPDLRGRIVYHNGTTGSALEFPYEDNEGHGTVVAAIAGGNPSFGIDSAGGSTAGYGYRDNDNGQFYWGLGVAPGVRIGSTKMMSGGATNVSVGSVSEWTRRAVTQYCNTPSDVCTATGTLCAAVVQNHSHNEYDASGTNAGMYTTNAREFDFAVRDADNVASSLTPLAITMSAGNYRQNSTDMTKQVMAAATAKNVISMGAVESVRTTPSVCLSEASVHPELRHLAQGYDVLAFMSRRGTVDGRLKPDLLAPATLSLGARTRNTSSSTSVCTVGGDSSKSYYPQYRGSSGTSFAAPAAAGAIALLRYHYGVPLSPAMYKAMLIAGGRSITGKLDRLETHLQGTTRAVTKWPNAQQGFGVVNLADLLDTNITKSRRDQTTILLSGETIDYTVTVADPTKPVRIGLAWTDAPAAAGAQVALVNDLDLRAFGYSFRVYGNITGGDDYSLVNPGCGRTSCSFYDSKNNAEVLNIPASVFVDSANRTFTVRVFAAVVNGVGVPGASGGANNQDFGLFVMNGTVQ